MEKLKLVQIVLHEKQHLEFGTRPLLLGLDEYGNVWTFVEKKGWKRLTMKIIDEEK